MTLNFQNIDKFTEARILADLYTLANKYRLVVLSDGQGNYDVVPMGEWEKEQERMI